MAGRVISIEIGYALTRVCETDYRSKSHHIYNSFTLPTEEGIQKDGVLSVTPAYVETLRQCLSEKGIRTKRVVFTINSTKIAGREVLIPYVKENRIADVVRANAEEYFPVDLSKYQLAYSVLGEYRDPKTGTLQHRLMVMAAPTTLLDGYYELAKALKLELLSLDYAGNSLYQVVKEECRQGVNLVVKIEELSTYIMVVQDGTLTFSRSINYGVEETVQVVREIRHWDESKSTREALQILQKEECEDIREALLPLIGRIARVIDYYVSRNAKTAVDRVLLTGLGANISGFDRLFTAETNYKSEILKEAAGWNLSGDFGKPLYGEYIACAGAGICPLGFRQEDAKRRKLTGKGAGQINTAITAYAVLGLGIVASLWMIGTSVFGYAGVRRQNTELRAQKTELEEMLPVYDDYVQTRNDYRKVSAMYEATCSNNDQLYELIGELEERLPSKVSVVALESDREKITINMNVPSKSDAAAAVEQLRTFEMLYPESVTVTSVSNLEEDAGDSVVNFTVTGSYRPFNEQEKEAGREVAE
jgi:type IV pilus assembly protein PilN